jgi:hypothetical protein
MRKALIGLLIAATAATPVASAAAQNWDGGGRRAERQQQRSERHQQRAERRQPRAQQAQPREARPQRQADVHARRERFQASPAQRRQWQGAQQQPARRVQRADTTYIPNRGRYVQARQDTRYNDGDRRGTRQYDGRRDRNSSGERRWDGRRDGNWNGDRQWSGRRDGNWNRSRDGHRRYSWNRGWRNDRRYDWHNHRNRYRHIYRPGRYYSPYRNHHYSRFSVGFFLEPLFFGSRYWISDPWHYRLPPAYPGTRWVRYYDDVLLVDMYSGEVLDVIYGFFW